MTDLFEAYRLVKRYRAKTVLNEVSLSVGSGHCVALLGHNGAGKTTLIKLLLGMYQPTSGRILMDGSFCSVRAMKFKSRGFVRPVATRDIRRCMSYTPFSSV